jgi:hypothetical protein
LNADPDPVYSQHCGTGTFSFPWNRFTSRGVEVEEQLAIFVAGSQAEKNKNNISKT